MARRASIVSFLDILGPGTVTRQSVETFRDLLVEVNCSQTTPTYLKGRLHAPVRPPRPHARTPIYHGGQRGGSKESNCLHAGICRSDSDPRHQMPQPPKSSIEGCCAAFAETGGRYFALPDMRRKLFTSRHQASVIVVACFTPPTALFAQLSSSPFVLCICFCTDLFGRRVLSSEQVNKSSNFQHKWKSGNVRQYYECKLRCRETANIGHEDRQVTGNEYGFTVSAVLLRSASLVANELPFGRHGTVSA